MPNHIRSALDGACAIGPTGKGKRPLRALSASDKIDAIQRVNDGESKASVARDIGVPESTLRGWCKNEDKLRYMSSRHSTPDTDKSTDSVGESLTNGIPEKRAKYDIPSVMNYNHPSSMATSTQYPETSADLSSSSAEPVNGLDLSRVKKDDSEMKSSELVTATDYSAYRSSIELSKNLNDLSKYNTDFLNNSLSKENKQKLESSPNMSMSAISPLTGLNHLSGISSLNQSHMGLSFNEIATNLSLIAQLNPSLSALTNSINTSAKALRSIRSPKPGHNSTSTGLNVTEKHKTSTKSHHNMPENYADKNRSSRSSHNSYKDQPIDEALWYWFKKQQAMMTLANSSSQVNPLGISHGIPTSRSSKDQYTSHSSKATPAMPSLIPPLDALNKNSWFWQYYKQFTGNLGIPDENGQLPMNSSNPLNKTESYENILYSHLTKEKTPGTSPIPSETVADHSDKNYAKEYDSPTPESCPTPPEKERNDKDRNSIKARAVLDNLLFNNNNNDINLKTSSDMEEGEKDSNAENEFGCEVNEALEHGEKFLKWLESCQEPSVTRMQVHQLKSLLNNIKANADRRNQNCNLKDRVSRRK